MEFETLIRRRRMVRRFAQQPIPEDVLHRVLEAARHAPSGGFSQGFDFIVLETAEQREWFYGTTEDPSDTDPSPGRDPAVAPATLVLPYANKRLYLERYAQPDKIAFGLHREERWPVPFWTVDTAMAIMLILLAAVDEGLGAWYYGIDRGQDEVNRHLGVPDFCVPLGVIALGVPAPDDRPMGSMTTRRRRPFEDMFHAGRW